MLSPETVLLEEPSQVFSCPVCLTNPLQQAVGFQCGHTVCSLCSNLLQQCPLCRAPIDLRFANYQIRAIVNTFKCRCDNYFDDHMYGSTRKEEDKCQKIMTLGERSAHLATCPFAYEYCSYCRTTLLRRDFDKHRLTCIRKKPLPIIDLVQRVALHVYTKSARKDKLLMYKITCPANAGFHKVVETLLQVNLRFQKARFFHNDIAIEEKFYSRSLTDMGLAQSPVKILAVLDDPNVDATATLRTLAGMIQAQAARAQGASEDNQS